MRRLQTKTKSRQQYRPISAKFGTYIFASLYSHHVCTGSRRLASMTQSVGPANGRQNAHAYNSILCTMSQFLNFLSIYFEAVCRILLLDFKHSPCSECCILCADVSEHSVPSPMKIEVEETKCSETTLHTIQTPGFSPKNNTTKILLACPINPLYELADTP